MEANGGSMRLNVRLQMQSRGSMVPIAFVVEYAWHSTHAVALY